MHTFSVEALPAADIGLTLNARTLFLAAAAFVTLGAILGVSADALDKRIRE